MHCHFLCATSVYASFNRMNITFGSIATIFNFEEVAFNVIELLIVDHICIS